LRINEDIVFSDALLGSWVSDSGEKCKFTKSGDNHYELLYVEDAPARFEARLIELGGGTYIDLDPKPLGKEIELYPANLVPAHTLARVTIGKESISVAMMNGDWLEKLFDRKDLALSHERVDGTIVLTAPTRELQAFVRKHAGDKELFGDAEVFHRIRSDE
jgi:hypothetical protein